MKKILKKIIALSLALISALCLFSGCEQNGEEVQLKAPTTNLSLPTFDQEKSFLITGDVPAKPIREYLLTYKDAGFTHYNLTEDWVYMTNKDQKYGTEDDAVLSQNYLDAIALCQELGLNVYIRNQYGDEDFFVNDDDSTRQAAYPWNYTYRIPVRNVTNELTQLGVDGYYMGDEPSWKEVLKYEKLVEWYNNYGGNTLWHMNLLQSYGAFLFEDEEGNMYNYEQYVDHFCDKVLSKVNGPKTLGTDYYGLLSGGLSGDNYVSDGMISDYFVIARKAKEMKAEGHDIITNFCIQSYERTTEEAGYVRFLTSQADITFQTNLALAFGAESFQYYTYRSYGSEPGIVDGSNHEPGKMYPWVKNANAYAQAMAEAILTFDWNGTKVYKGMQGGSTTDKHTAQAFEKVEGYVLDKFQHVAGITARLDTLVSEFKDEGGNVGYMVVNYSEPSKGLTGDVIINFAKKTNKAIIYQNGNKSVVDVKDNKLKITLEAGGGAFVYPAYVGA